MGGRGASLSRKIAAGERRYHREQQLVLAYNMGELITMPGESFVIGRSLGAKALNYDVNDPSTGKVYRFVEGTTIDQIEVFAGSGVRNKLRREVVEGLHEHYGGRPKNWQHVKGIGTLDYHGRPREAEVHWFQEKASGTKVKFKIKRWLES